jgi:methylenetetrahydrofolate reductase (NADPH)
MTAQDAAPTSPSFDDAIRRMGYEVLPFKGTREKVLRFVPKGVHLTVTASPPKGIDATIDLATDLAREGYSVAPHLSARMIADTDKLREIVQRLEAAKIDSIFVVGGDAQDPGDFPDAIALLRALDGVGHSFTDVGIGGYPEGHATISDEALDRALSEKAPYAHHMVTQICFSAPAISRWAAGLQRRGVALPIRVGIPGAVTREKLVRITASIGLGESAKFLTKQRGMLLRFFVPGGYSPDKVMKGLRRDMADPGSTLDTFHVYTFNDLEKTEEWRQHLLARVEPLPLANPAH